MGRDDRFSVADRVVLVTGAGHGLGRAIALAFAEAGATLVLASRTLAEVEETATLARDRGAAATALTGDLTSVASIDRMVGAARAAHGRLDILVNNAGVYLNRPAVETTEADWDLMADTNLKGVFFCSCRVATAMIEQGVGGRIITISSALSLVAQHGYACYGATKAGVEQLTRVLALEWAPHRITVNAVAPTTTPTRPADIERLATPEGRERARTTIPLGRFGEPEDVIGAVLYFASPAATFVTGQTLIVDGGLSLP
jgi:2-deoxy-D-gluconate 3-dehydrogenase